MKVRATQDGHYGGYYRYGPSDDGEGNILPGEVFEIDATPHPVRDEQGQPIQDMRQGEISPVTGVPTLVPVWELDNKGNPKRDPKTGNFIPKIKMATYFSPEWMEPVNEDATVTYPEHREPFGVLAQMRPGAKKAPSVTARPVKLPSDIAAVLAGDTQAGKELKQVLESPI